MLGCGAWAALVCSIVYKVEPTLKQQIQQQKLVWKYSWVVKCVNMHGDSAILKRELCDIKVKL